VAEGIAQTWVATARGRHLAGRRKTGTVPELALRKALYAMGLRYRVGCRVAPGFRPDVLFTRARVAIFVDGCFWHGCPDHGRKVFQGPNQRLWEAKLLRNRRNDAKADANARDMGFAVVRVWECEIRRSPEVVARRIEPLVRK